MLILAILISISPAKASFSSFLIPGTGDLLLGEKKRASVFLTAEATIWLSYFGFRWYEGKVHNSSLNYASLYADANLYGKDDRYFDAMENFYSSENYNEWVKEQARMMYPDTTDPEILEKRREYINENSYTGEDAWEWRELKYAYEYDELRDRKRGFANKASNMVALAIANRFISFFVTYIAGSRVSVRVDQDKVEVGWRF
ncbi:hypothetical protein KAW18_03310 [candidate division WOR-3 bacterium]|nr:hypothetical protein [candidate division WOR-3 bacterium]MCK4526375.1 hypothetical protein [candidate division WOR-3 bacterium]